MNIYLLRHTKPNIPKGICYGQTNVNTAETFESEKKKIIEQIENINFDKIYSSPLRRCSKLAKTLAKKPKDIIFDKRLMELNFGIWENKKWDEIEKTEEAKLWFDDYLNIACPGGESYVDLIERIQNFINDLSKNYSYKNILIVTHGGVIKAFYSIYKDIHPLRALDLVIEHGQIMKIETQFQND